MRLKLLLLLSLLLLTPRPALAQTGSGDSGTAEQPIPKVHVVQEGETLTSIAAFYNTTVEDLQLINHISDPSLLYAGQSLIIPGVTGEAVATVYTIQAGDTLPGLAAAFNTTPAAIGELNHLLQPDALYAGQSLAVVSRTGSAAPRPPTGRPHVIQPGESLLELAARYHLSLAALADANHLTYPYRLLPGQRLRIPGEEPYQFLSGEWVAIQMHPLPAVQGEAVAVTVENLLSGQPAGHFAGQPLRFAPWGKGYVALVGLDAFTEPGLYTLELESAGGRPWSPFSQAIQVVSGNYGTEIVTVPAEQSDLLAPEVRAEEDAFLATIYSQFTPAPQWAGPFQTPVTTTIVTSGYGVTRSYNGGAYEIYHTGVDFAAAAGTLVLAPAAGTVVFSDTLELRGNTLILDHGLGVMTGYYHLTRSLVKVGDVVAAGQPIAEVGSTGLSSGAHLHWDLRVHNVPVNGRQWTRERFP
ncbi:MAG: LysM peptidoglycan-binding domain-containing protein [Chloroflexota bacterium]